MVSSKCTNDRKIKNRLDCAFGLTPAASAICGVHLWLFSTVCLATYRAIWLRNNFFSRNCFLGPEVPVPNIRWIYYPSMEKKHLLFQSRLGHHSLGSIFFRMLILTGTAWAQESQPTLTPTPISQLEPTAAMVLMRAPRPTPISGLTPVPAPAIPQLHVWEFNMTQAGAMYCNQAEINAAIGPNGVSTEANVWYYDGTRVFAQIAAYTKNPFWLSCAAYTNNAYRSWVLALTNGVSWPVGQLAGWRLFPDGLLWDYQRNGNTSSKEAINRMASWSPFAAPAGGASCELSRETAYIIDVFLAAERAGQPRDPRLATAVNYALGHIDQWFVTKTCSDMLPWMVSLTLEALINYHERTNDSRITPKVQLAADELWRTAWLPDQKAFFYQSSANPKVPAGDVNLMIAPAYAWLWQRTADAKYQQRGDEIFSSGINASFFWPGGGKLFSQNYRWTFSFVKWRSTMPNPAAVTTGYSY
jgi:hypothetical protein